MIDGYATCTICRRAPMRSYIAYGCCEDCYLEITAPYIKPPGNINTDKMQPNRKPTRSPLSE